MFLSKLLSSENSVFDVKTPFTLPSVGHVWAHSTVCIHLLVWWGLHVLTPGWALLCTLPSDQNTKTATPWALEKLCQIGCRGLASMEPKIFFLKLFFSSLLIFGCNVLNQRPSTSSSSSAQFLCGRSTLTVRTPLMPCLCVIRFI